MSDNQDVEPFEDEELDLLDDELDETRLERFLNWLNGQQWISVVVLVAGIVLIFVEGRRPGFMMIGTAVALAGMFPVATGYYRSPVGVLLGWKARLRGLVSVGIGVTIAMIGYSIDRIDPTVYIQQGIEVSRR